MILETALLCLALNVYHEARGEMIPGQYAVAQVTMNRAGGDKEKVCETVTAKRQFSWTHKALTKKDNKRYALKPHALPKDEQAWTLALRVAHHTLKNKPSDITSGATHYHTTKIKPHWAKSMQYVRRIGRHVFYTA